MPVPVPRVIKPIAHPVVKSRRGIAQTTDPTPPTLPISPVGPPPSFGTREEWINSLPSWRRTKPRRIWEEDTRLPDHCAEQRFPQGLAVADNAMAIKGARADACLPPMVTEPVHQQAYPQGDAGAQMSHDAGCSGHAYCRGYAEWEGDDAMNVEEDVDATSTSPNLVFTDLATYENQTYHRGVFSPIYEDHSPGTDSGPDTGSSPLEPITPFADFIDRAVAAEQPYASGENDHFSMEPIVEYGSYKNEKPLPDSRLAPVFPTLAEPPKEPASAADVVIPTSSSGYKKLAEPLSEWLADYVWKVCTTGFSLPAIYTYPSTHVIQYPSIPPSYLAPSIHSLLLSTLLQPSAIFLAIWYIVRLPAYLNAAELGLEYAKETSFRLALLGETYSYERESLELNAPFRLIVLGCMLANKWLDDHTFSNKTWHTISNVPIQVLNRLELLALDMFSYDLSISTRDWSLWMAHVKSYHMSLTSTHLQPISRPSSNPHSIIRKSMDEIIQAAASCDKYSPIPQPVFLGFEERQRAKLEKEQASAVDVLEIDLDEDGPLREEYLPRRRINGPGTAPVAHGHSGIANVEHENIHGSIYVTAKLLPPPAKWSPAGDEPILRDRNRSSGQYVAVQPSHPYLYPMPYRAPDVAYNHTWDASFGAPFKTYSAYNYGHPQVPVNSAPYNPYPHQQVVAMTHSRSQSLFYDSDNLSFRNHLRSYSQSCFDYKCGDIRMSSHDQLAPFEQEQRWVEANQYVYPGPAYGHPVPAGPAWLRA